MAENPKVKSIDVSDAKKAIKDCPKIVIQYVGGLERALEASQTTTSKAISKLREVSAAKNVVPLETFLKVRDALVAIMQYHDALWHMPSYLINEATEALESTKQYTDASE